MTFLELAAAIDAAQVVVDDTSDAKHTAAVALAGAEVAYEEAASKLNALYAEMQSKINPGKVQSDPTTQDLKSLYLAGQKLRK